MCFLCGGLLVSANQLWSKIFYNSIHFSRGGTVGWVDVSRPLNLMDLARDIILELSFNDLRQGTMWAIKHPIQQCRQILSSINFTLVIDGLQCTKEWDLIRDALLPNNIGSSQRVHIFVITNEERVGLEADNALKFFKRKVRLRIRFASLPNLLQYTSTTNK